MSRSRTRPSREETRARLFAAAATAFVRSGIAGTSVEDICLEAGLTRGALYSNFANKDELVMAMIDEHVERDLAELGRLFDVAASPQEYLELIESPERRRDGPLGHHPVLYMEFTLYAVRDPSNRPRLAEHQRRWREAVASVVRRDAERLGVEPPMPVDDAAAMIVAIDNGYLLAELIEPGSYQPGTFSRNLLTLQTLWAATAQQQTEPEAPDNSPRQRRRPAANKHAR